MRLSRSRSFLVLSMVAGLMLGFGPTPQAVAQTTITFLKCVPGAPSTVGCDNVLNMKNTVRLQLANLPLGSIVLASTDAYPISGFFRRCTGPRGLADYCPITSDEAAMAALDNELNARAASINPVDIPPEVGTGVGIQPETINSYVTGFFTAVGAPQTSWWHGITNFPIVTYYTVVDARDGSQHQVFINDRIVVKFTSTGMTAELKYVGPLGPQNQQWLYVEGTLRNADGTPYVPPPPPAAANPVGVPIGLVANYVPSAGGILLQFAAGAICKGHSIVSGTGWSYIRDFYFPC